MTVTAAPDEGFEVFKVTVSCNDKTEELILIFNQNETFATAFFVPCIKRPLEIHTVFHARSFPSDKKILADRSKLFTNISITANKSGKYTFKMPKYDVNVTVEFNATHTFAGVSA